MADLGLLRELRKSASGKSYPLWAKSEGSLQNTSHCLQRVLVITGVSQSKSRKVQNPHYFYRFVKEHKRNQSSYDEN